MSHYAFFFDASRCTGCKTCELACKDYKKLPVDYTYRRVFDYEGGTWNQADEHTWTHDVFSYHISIACNHCEKPACTKVCPTTAMHKDPETQLVIVDANKCIGCGYCELACPYGAPHVDREIGHSVKCDGCMTRTKAGQKPICVEACPLRALDFGPEEEIEKNHKEIDGSSVAPLPDMSYTMPYLYIKPCKSSRPAGDKEGKIANLKEVM